MPKNKTLWERYKESNLNRKVISPVWSAAWKPSLPKAKTGIAPIDTIYEHLIRDMSSPAGAALNLFPLGRAAKYFKRGLTTPFVQGVKGAKNVARKASRGTRAMQEAKQAALTLGYPGTGISYHGASLAAANLKATPWKELPKEIYKTTRMMYNPEKAIKYNKELTGGISPQRKFLEFENAIKAANPTLNRGQVKRAANYAVDAYAQVAPARFKDLWELQKGGLKTASSVGGAAGQVMDTERFLTKAPGIKQVARQFESFFDQPLFGEEYINEYFKRRTALSRLDELRKAGVTKAPKEAALFGNKILGGFGYRERPFLKSPNWGNIFVAPDWMSRHINLWGKEIPKAFTTQLRNPVYSGYRSYAGKSAALAGATAGLNKATTGKWIPDRAQDIFSTHLPYKEGEEKQKQPLWVNVGTEMDAPKSVIDVANAFSSLIKEDPRDFRALTDIWRNRLHPVTSALVDIGQGQGRWTRDTLTGEEPWAKTEKLGGGMTRRYLEDIPPKEEGLRIGKVLAESILPSVWDALTTPNINKTDFYGKMFEMPVRTYTPKYEQIESREDRRLRRKTKPPTFGSRPRKKK